VNTALNENSDISNEQSGGTSEQNFFCAFDGRGKPGAGYAPEVQMNTETMMPRRMDQNEGPSRYRTKRPTAQPISVFATRELNAKKSGAELWFRDGDGRDQRPERIVPIGAIENKPHEDATDENSNGVLQEGSGAAGAEVSATVVMGFLGCVPGDSKIGGRWVRHGILAVFPQIYDPRDAKLRRYRIANEFVANTLGSLEKLLWNASEVRECS
jgi:hypothetical protein